jgi:AraC-like DNA-binding protein
VDRDLARRFLGLCAALADDPAPRLEQDALLLAALTLFVERHAAAGLRSPPVGAEPRAVALVKAYLDAHAAEEVSLARLAEVAGLSSPYLNRAFARAVGLPPHRYQTQLRIDRAKALLAAGLPRRAVASETGFADQSHFGRHFKRLVGVTPGRYRAETADRRTEGQRA